MMTISSVMPDFDQYELIPAIIQDAASGEVLMLAYMNAASYRLTIETGQTHFWSRSRRSMWHKGETSGNIQHVVEIRVDCDQDTLLILVTPEGPACHTGNTSCFYRKSYLKESSESAQINPSLNVMLNDASQEPFTLLKLYDIILARRDRPSPESYTSQLLNKGEDEIIKKIGEEAIEIILAAKSQGDERLIEEIADLTYHILVLLAERNITPDDILSELARRHKRG